MKGGLTVPRAAEPDLDDQHLLASSPRLLDEPAAGDENLPQVPEAASPPKRRRRSQKPHPHPKQRSAAIVVAGGLFGDATGAVACGNGPMIEKTSIWLKSIKRNELEAMLASVMFLNTDRQDLEAALVEIFAL